jgi:hypothetical protein
MEYVQTVLVQIPADRIDEAARPGGLITELDEHRAFLEQQHGFHDLRVTRSINPEGNVLLVVETRWADDESLVRYETGEPNVASVIGRHQDVTVPNSLQVLDMEALRAGAGRAPITPQAAAFERLVLPLMIPLGVLSFALLVIYGLSRIYLELDNKDVATGLAAGIAIGILLTAMYLGTRPSVPGWQIAGIAVVAAAALSGGALFAVINEDEGEATGEETPTATAEPTGTPTDGGPAGALALTMGDNFFDLDGERNPAIPVTAGEETTIDLENTGQAIHNMRIAGADDEYNTDDDFVSDPDLFAGGDTGSITFTLDEPGTYNYRCDFHPLEMVGTLEAQ